MSTLLAPFLIGLAGGLHCIGMCSPLAMAVIGTRRNAFFRNLQYNLGRMLTYGTLGSIVGFAGSGLHLVGLQQWVSIGVGLILLAVGITNVRIAAPAIAQGHIFKLSNILKNQFRQVLNNRTAFGTVLLGMINGLLPCGMTLVALGYCITLGSPTDGFLAMLFFGLGTLPVMVGFVSLTCTVIGKVKVSYKTIQSVLMIASAIILIGRGIWSHEEGPNGRSGDNDEIVVCVSADQQ